MYDVADGSTISEKSASMPGPPNKRRCYASNKKSIPMDNGPKTVLERLSTEQGIFEHL